MVLGKFLFIVVLFVITLPVWYIGYRSCLNELKRIDHDATIANIRTEPSERDFRKFFEAPSEQFQQFAQNSENRRRRVVLRRLIAFRVVACAWCILLAVTCAVFFSGCTTTRNLSNTYNVTLDSVNYKFGFEHSETITSKKE
jgi:hypothetical protein